MSRSSNPGVVSRAITAVGDSLNFKEKKARKDARLAGQEIGLSIMTSSDSRKLFSTIGINATIPTNSVIVLGFVNKLEVENIPGDIVFCVPNKHHDILVKDKKGGLVQRIAKTGLSGDGSILINPLGHSLVLEPSKKDS